MHGAVAPRTLNGNEGAHRGPQAWLEHRNGYKDDDHLRKGLLKLLKKTLELLLSFKIVRSKNRLKKFFKSLKSLLCEMKFPTCKGPDRPGAPQ